MTTCACAHMHVWAQKTRTLFYTYPLPLITDPPAGDVGTNAQHAACPATDTLVPGAAVAAAAAAAGGYAVGQDVEVLAPQQDGSTVRGPLALPAGLLSAECVASARVGFLAALAPASAVWNSCHARLA